MNITEKSDFGRTSHGETAHLYTIRSGNLEAKISDFGATLVSYSIENAGGNRIDVTTGYDEAGSYEKGSAYFGAVIGRNANRTAEAAFRIDGKQYFLTANEGRNNLHSGPKGYDKRIWKTESAGSGEDQITFSLHSPDGDQGFPGTMDITVCYILSAETGLTIRYQAVSDQDTVCNLTNHSYFNLNGQGNGEIGEHLLKIFSREITPVRADSIPTGEKMKVEGTPFDFTSEKKIGADIDADEEQLKRTGGYDHNYVLADSKRDRPVLAAEVFSPDSGIGLEVRTDLPGLQFYSGNFIGEQIGKGGKKYFPRCAFALESQYFPNSLNTGSFPSPILKAGEKYDSTTVYRLKQNP